MNEFDVCNNKDLKYLIVPPELSCFLCFPLGVSVLAVGVSNADIEELNKITAPTSYKNIFYSPTFDDFPSIEREFINSLCSEELSSEFKLHEEARKDTKKTVFSLLSFFVITWIDRIYYGPF